MPVTRARRQEKDEMTVLSVKDIQQHSVTASCVSISVDKKFIPRKGKQMKKEKSDIAPQVDEVDGESPDASQLMTTSKLHLNSTGNKKHHRLTRTKTENSRTSDEKQGDYVSMENDSKKTVIAKKRKADNIAHSDTIQKKSRLRLKENHRAGLLKSSEFNVEDPPDIDKPKPKARKIDSKQNVCKEHVLVQDEPLISTKKLVKRNSTGHNQKKTLISRKGTVSEGTKATKSAVNRVVSGKPTSSRKEKCQEDKNVKLGRCLETGSSMKTITTSMAADTNVKEDTSSSDSDFEEVPTQYRTPESSFVSTLYSDSSVLKSENTFSPISSSEDRFSSFTNSQSTSFSSRDNSDYFIEKKPTIKNKRVLSGNKTLKTNRGKLETQQKVTKLKNCGKKSRKDSSVFSDSQRAKPPKVDEDDIMATLMLMEGHQEQSNKVVTVDKPSTSQNNNGSRAGQKRKAASVDKTEADSSEESEWEEVEALEPNPDQSQLPNGPVEIIIDDPTLMHKKRKKKEFDWQAYIQRKIKRRAREIQVEMHKVSLLCLVAHGMLQNQVCCDATVCSTALSVVPLEELKKDVAFRDADSLLAIVKWFRTAISLATNAVDGRKLSLVKASQLLQAFSGEEVSETRVLVMVLVTLLRAMGFNVRLVMSLQPIPLKHSISASSKNESENKTANPSKTAKSAGSQKTAANASSSNSSRSQPSSSKIASKKSGQGVSEMKGQRKGKQVIRKKKKEREDSSSSDSDDGGDSVPSQRMVSTRPRKAAQANKVKSSSKNEDGGGDYMISGDSDDSDFSDEELNVMKRKKKNKAGQRKSAGKTGRLDKQETGVKNEESGAEFDHSFNTKSLTVKDAQKHKKSNRKILSDDSSPERVTKSKGRDCWLEVYLPRPRKWLCVDCIRCTVGRPFDTGAAASKPLLYVLGFANDGSVKDITAKYAPQWLSHTRKQRVDTDWWTESLEPYATTNTKLDDDENKTIKEYLVQRPLPTNIGDFKNHPLYALQRHLLKFEAIYPESSIPVGYIRHEAVYARECVHTLHSRENWLREARVVRIGETAYKMVKSRKRWNRARDHAEEVLDLELFGHWQTEVYIPPPAVNGKIPKNDYGNVEMFQPSMLPGGTVHVRVPALNRVARKLNIDIAPAMTGWDYHCGSSHPVLDGWIVCEEHKEVLLAAWAEDQKIQRQREEEKREKRVLGNWTTLVRTLLIKEKLKKKFNLEEKPAMPKAKAKQAKVKKGEIATDVQHAWPAKQQHKQKTEKEKPKLPPSHFVVETM